MDTLTTDAPAAEIIPPAEPKPWISCQKVNTPSSS